MTSLSLKHLLCEDSSWPPWECLHSPVFPFSSAPSSSVSTLWEMGEDDACTIKCVFFRGNSTMSQGSSFCLGKKIGTLRLGDVQIQIQLEGAAPNGAEQD